MGAADDISNLGTFWIPILYRRESNKIMLVQRCIWCVNSKFPFYVSSNIPGTYHTWPGTSYTYTWYIITTYVLISVYLVSGHCNDCITLLHLTHPRTRYELRSLFSYIPFVHVILYHTRTYLVPGVMESSLFSVFVDVPGPTLPPSVSISLSISAVSLYHYSTSRT